LSDDVASFVNLEAESRTIYMSGDVSPEMAHVFIQSMESLERESDEDIRISCSLNGGTEADGWAIYDILRQSKCDTIMDVYGYAYSMGAAILQGADIRRLYPSASVMVHQGTVDRSCLPEDQGALKSYARQLEHDFGRYIDVLARRTQQSAKKIRAWCNQETYFRAEEAVRYGFADNVLIVHKKRK
jgi:ATP-dependent Clp protease protease subunit